MPNVTMTDLDDVMPSAFPPGRVSISIDDAEALRPHLRDAREAAEGLAVLVAREHPQRFHRPASHGQSDLARELARRARRFTDQSQDSARALLYRNTALSMALVPHPLVAGHDNFEPKILRAPLHATNRIAREAWNDVELGRLETPGAPGGTMVEVHDVAFHDGWNAMRIFLPDRPVYGGQLYRAHDNRLPVLAQLLTVHKGVYGTVFTLAFTRDGHLFHGPRRKAIVAPEWLRHSLASIAGRAAAEVVEAARSGGEFAFETRDAPAIWADAVRSRAEYVHAS